MNLFKKYRVGLLFSLTMVLFLSGVYVFQELTNQQTPTFQEEPVVKVDENEDDQQVVSNPATSTVESLQRPYKDDGVTVARYFYNPTASESERNNALVLFEGVYRPNQGVDYSNNNTTFDVFACLSGTVTKTSNDPVLGWLVTVESVNGIEITYQSLGEVSTSVGKEIKQGDLIGKSGENIYQADLKNHLHMILEKDGTLLNIENYYDKKVNEFE